MNLLKIIMEKIMNINKIFISISIIIAILLICIPTVNKVVTNYHDKLYYVVEEKIINAAKKCYFEEKCHNDKIYLHELYNNEYIELVINPVTKEYYNENSYVLREDNVFKLYFEE